jgi:hypothetical protein
MRRFLFAASIAGAAVLSLPIFGQANSIDPQTARKYFDQLQQTSARDAGKLWGRPIYGPIFFVDRQTREVVANQSDAEGVLKPKNGVFIGTFPQDRNIANSAIDWAGVHWTMVTWPFSAYRQPRERLLLHECFHRIQDTIGLPGRDAVNNHLDSRDGRIWLQMEWRALERALRQPGAERKQAIGDALLFRAYRRSLFPDAAQRENALELNEGMAEYTGYRLSSSTMEEFAVRADQVIRDGRSNPTFARSFAYVSGPAYGALLDMSGKPWRNRVAKTVDLGTLLAAAYRIQLAKVDEHAAQIAMARYEGEEIIALETRRDEQRQRDIAAARRRFVEGPVLVLPLTSNVNYSYDPTNVFAIDTANTVYPTLRLVDEWGILEVSDGAWLFRDGNGHFTRAQVDAPESASARPLKGKGWSLELKDGWGLTPGERSGDLIVSKTTTTK